MMHLTKKSSLRSAVVVLVVMIGATTHARAQGGCATGSLGCGAVVPTTPEIDPSLGTGAVTLIGGAILIVRSRRRQ